MPSSSRCVVLRLVAALLASGCVTEPATPNAVAADEQPPAKAASSAPLPAPATVRFGDLGLRFTIPAGWRVLSDAELIAKIDALAPKERAANLREWVKRVDGPGPLLVLERSRPWMATILAAIPLADGDRRRGPIALVDHLRELLVADHADFELLEPAHAVDAPGGAAAELTGRFGPWKNRQSLRIAFTRTHAVFTTVSWPNALGDRPDEATRVLRGAAPDPETSSPP